MQSQHSTQARWCHSMNQARRMERDFLYIPQDSIEKFITSMARLKQFSHDLSGTSSDNKDDDTIQFIDEDTDGGAPFVALIPWKILIADDDANVHETTTLALRGVRIHGRPLEFLHAYSAKEAHRILAQNEDIQLLLLDVVMETVDAGLKLVGTIRNELKRSALKIILRTGQPGNTSNVISGADMAINGYTTKSQLTRSLLISVLTDSLPSN